MIRCERGARGARRARSAATQRVVQARPPPARQASADARPHRIPRACATTPAQACWQTATRVTLPPRAARALVVALTPRALRACIASPNRMVGFLYTLSLKRGKASATGD